MIGEAESLVADTYTAMLEALAPVMKQAPYFILHSAHRKEDGKYRVLEVWASKAASDAFFASVVAPNLPPGLRPKRTTHELASLVVGPDLAMLGGPGVATA